MPRRSPGQEPGCWGNWPNPESTASQANAAHTTLTQAGLGLLLTLQLMTDAALQALKALLNQHLGHIADCATVLVSSQGKALQEIF